MCEKGTLLFYIVYLYSYSAPFFGSLTQCQQPQGYLCVFLLYVFCLCLVILQLKFSFCKENTTPRHAAHLMPWNCTFMH